MTPSLLVTEAEKHALAASRLTAFDNLNLDGLKRNLQVLLGLIGRDGIFDEYTVHDISHIDSMLRSLDWLIPKESKARMTPADWLMTVLAVYFHDLGMLVTKHEFANRSTSGFPQFCDQVLFMGQQGIDYKAKVDCNWLPSRMPAMFGPLLVQVGDS